MHFISKFLVRKLHIVYYVFYRWEIKMSHGGSSRSVVGTTKEHKMILTTVILLLFGYLLGAYGYYQAFEALYGHASIVNCFYDAFGLFEFKLEFTEHVADLPYSLEIARWVIAGTLLFAGSYFIYRVIKNYLKFVWFKLLYKDKTIVIFGANEKSNHLALDLLREKKHKLIIIEEDKNNHYLESLSSHGAVFFVKDPAAESTIRKVLHATNESSEFICMTEDDATNLKIFEMLIKDKVTSGNIYVHVGNRMLNDILSNMKNINGTIKSFNVSSNAARQLFLENPINKNIDTTKDGEQVRIAVIGESILAQEVIFHALNLGGFYNRSKLHIAIINDSYKNLPHHTLYSLDLNAPELDKYFEFEYLSSADFYADNTTYYSHVVIAQEDSNQALVSITRSVDKFRNVITNPENKDKTIVISAYSIKALVGVGQDIDFNGSRITVNSFGDFDKHFVADVIIDKVFDRLAAYNNYIYDESHSNQVGNDDGVEAFKQLDVFSQDSNRSLVDHIITVKYYEYLRLKNHKASKLSDQEILEYYHNEKLLETTPIYQTKKYDEVRSNLSNVDVIRLAEAEHARWNIFHLTRGWKKTPNFVTDRKNLKMKFHSCIVDWSELDEVSEKYGRDFKIDDIETIFRIALMHEQCDKK